MQQFYLLHKEYKDATEEEIFNLTGCYYACSFMVRKNDSLFCRTLPSVQ